MSIKRDCNSCACNKVCSRACENNMSHCNDWISKELIERLNARKGKAPALLLVTDRIRKGEPAEAQCLLEHYANSIMKECATQLNRYYECDWPLVLAMMKLFTETQLSKLPDEAQKMTKVFEQGAQCITINIGNALPRSE